MRQQTASAVTGGVRTVVVAIIEGANLARRTMPCARLRGRYRRGLIEVRQTAAGRARSFHVRAVIARPHLKKRHR